MSVYYPTEIVEAEAVCCPNCCRPVRAVLRQNLEKVAYPCGCGLNNSWASAFDAEMKSRSRGADPSDVAAKAESLRTVRLRDALAEFKALLSRRASAIFRTDYDAQKKHERQLLIKRSFLLTEGANAADVAALDAGRFHPEIYDEADSGRIALPPDATCWSPFPYSLTQTELYGAVDTIEDFRRYSENARHEAARSAFADRNAAVAGVGTAIRELNAFTYQIYTFLLPETASVLSVRASETPFLDQHPSEALNRRLTARTHRRVMAVNARQRPPAYDRGPSSPEFD